MGYIRLLWDLYQLKRNTAKSEEQIKMLQDKKLRKLLRYAYQHSAYYHKAFTQAGISEQNIDWIAINEFPVIDKELLMQNYDELVTDSKVKQEELRKFDESPASKSENYLGRYHIIHSSGSTGIPRYFVYDDKAWGQMLLGIIRGALWGMSMIDILKLLAGKPRILYIAATDGRYAGAMAVGDGITGLRAKQEYLDINEPIEMGNQKVTKFDPNIVIGYPSAIKLMAEQVRLGRVPNHVRRVISCGEPLSVGLRNSNDSYGFSRAEVLLCRNEDEMWFRKADGTKEFIHPLSVEGICVDGLKDYQFVQTSEKSFQIRAEISEDASKEAIIQGIESVIEPLLSEKALGNIYYEICFVDTVEVNTDTGKKPLIIKQMNNSFDIKTMNYKAV